MRTKPDNVVPFPSDASSIPSPPVRAASPHFMHLNLGDWAEGVAGFTCEQEGFYLRLVRRLYAVGGKLLDDDGRNAKRLLVDKRVYERLKAFLLDEGKITLVDGHIVNGRVSRDLEAIATKRAEAAERGRKGPEARKAKALQQAAMTGKKHDLPVGCDRLPAGLGPTLPGSPAETSPSDPRKSCDTIGHKF